MRLHNTSIVSAIKLTEKGQVPKDVQVLRVGKFKHPSYGNFEITSAVLSEMKAHFDNRIRGIDTAFDYYHESNEDASGWVQSLELREDGKELWAIVDWTPTATRKLADREVRYFSPDFSFKWTDPESGAEYNNVLFGGGLTNRPFVKEMKAIVAHEKPNQGNEMTELEKAQAALKSEQEKTVKLSEEKAAVEKQLTDILPKADKVAALEKQIADLQAELAKEKAAGENMLAEKVKADEAAKLAEKTSAFNVLLSEGKAVAAQKDAFIKGDMTEFIKLAQPANLKGSGSSESTTPDLSDRETKVLKLAEEKMAAKPGLSKADAISLALKEVK